MNVQNLRENYPELISYMTENGYSESYVVRFSTQIKNIIESQRCLSKSRNKFIIQKSE